MEWEKEQNLFSIENRKIYSQNQRYRYYRNHTRMVYRMGAYRYSITGELFGEQIGKDLKEDGIENDGRCYYWNLFWGSCTFEKNIDVNWEPDLKKDTYIVGKIKKGQWKFPHQIYENLKRYISQIDAQLMPSQKLVVYIPKNKLIESQVEYNYISDYIEILREVEVTYVIGNLDNIKVSNKQLVIIVLDIITNKERLKSIIKKIRTKKEKEQPVISFFSLMKIYDLEDCRFSLNVYNYKKKKEEEQREEKRIVRVSDYDEEEMIMRSLMGRGPDPEIFGF